MVVVVMLGGVRCLDGCCPYIMVEFFPQYNDPKYQNVAFCFFEFSAMLVLYAVMSLPFLPQGIKQTPVHFVLFTKALAQTSYPIPSTYFLYIDGFKDYTMPRPKNTCAMDSGAGYLCYTHHTYIENKKNPAPTDLQMIVLFRK